jgi:DNA-binding PadR family transcriptional regulator
MDIEKDLVAARWGKSETGQKRKYERITRQGRTQLAVERERRQVVDDTLRGIWMKASTA